MDLSKFSSGTCADVHIYKDARGKVSSIRMAVTVTDADGKTYTAENTLSAADADAYVNGDVKSVVAAQAKKVYGEFLAAKASAASTSENPGVTVVKADLP